MTNLYKNMANLLHQGEGFVLATILSKIGSSPGTAGTKMAVRRDGTFYGTIGGGLVEAKVLQLATRVMETGRPLVEKFNLTGTDVANMDMICGGQVEVLVENIDADDQSFRAACELANNYHPGNKAVLVTQFYDAAKGTTINKHYLVKDAGETEMLPKAVATPILKGNLGKYPQVINTEKGLYLLEPLVSFNTLIIMGAGHISRKLCPLASMVDFKTVVLDDRPEFANREGFPTADKIMVINSFETAFEDLEVDESSYIVIVTRGHAYDKIVLRQALTTPAAYIGMIGSIRKRNAIYSALLKEGFSQADIDRVYSPIGLAIGAITPEEIAISIMAEIIKVRAEKTYGNR